MNRAHYVIYTTPKVCVDKIQSPATERVCLDKIRGRVQKLNHKSWTIKRGIKSPEPAAAGSGRVSYPLPTGMLPHQTRVSADVCPSENA